MMKQDKLVSSMTLVAGSDLARRATVTSAHPHTIMSDGGAKLLAVRTKSIVNVPLERRDLSQFNTLVINLRLGKQFEGSLVTRLLCGSRAPGMTENDSYASVLHFNQPSGWGTQWQRLVMPDVNLVPTGFGDGWKNISSISLDVHSRSDQGEVIFGDIELLSVERPQGPRMSDDELLAVLDLGRPELKTVARHAASGNITAAMGAYARHLRRKRLPPLNAANATPHYRPHTPDELCNHLIMEQQLPRKIDWHCNPIGYLEWGHAFNRHGWLSNLADAALETGKARYGREVDYLMRSWIEQNPEPIGHNGGLDPAWETLSTSIRMGWSWPHLLRLARKCPQIRDRTLLDMSKMVHAHAEHLLNYWGHCNWFVSESNAILTAAAYYPEFQRAQHWAATAMPRLESEIRAQVFPDGAQYELSPGYHAMCAHLFNLARRQAEFRGSQFSDEYKRRLDRMFDYLTAITRPDGSCAVPNDAGCALQRGNNRLLEAAELYKRDDWRWAGSHGQAGVRPDHVGTVDFTDAGHVVMRSGWDPDDRWAFFDVAELGAAHQHEDKLHVDLYAFKTPFLIDPGISSYQHDPVVVFFRESRAHNTIDVDGLGQWRRRSGDYARFSSSSRGKNLFSAGKLLDFAQGSYDDIYGNAAAGALENIVHTRALVFVRPDYWLIIDSIRDSADNTTPRTIEAFWHFTPMHVRADTATGIVRTNRLSHANLEMVFRGHWDGAELELVTAREEPVQGFVAIDMEVKPATCAIARTTRPLPMHGVTVALPYATGSESQCRVTSADVASRSGTGAGLAVTVARADGSQDLFVWRHTGKGALELKSGGTSGRPAIASDALLSMVRLDKAGQPIAAALTHGRRLSVGNRKIDGLPQGLAEWQA